MVGNLPVRYPVVYVCFRRRSPIAYYGCTASYTKSSLLITPVGRKQPSVVISKRAIAGYLDLDAPPS